MRRRALAIRSAGAAVVVLLVGLAGVMASCDGERPEAELRVFAAASLREAFSDIAQAFERAHPDARVRVSFAGSQALRTQIENGAPADVFASADAAQVEALRAAGLTAGAAAVFTVNEIVLAVPAGNPGRVLGFDDLTRPGLRLIMAAEAVPAGQYARIALRGYAAATGRDSFTSAVLDSVVSSEPNVRLVASKVKLGEADAGFIYRTDVLASQGALEAIETPASAEVAAPYTIAVLRGAAAPDQAARFVAFIRGTDGQRILQDHGFRTPV